MFTSNLIYTKSYPPDSDTSVCRSSFSVLLHAQHPPADFLLIEMVIPDHVVFYSDSPMLRLYSHSNTYTNDHRYHTHRYLHLTGRHTHHFFDLSFSLFTIFVIIKQHLFSCPIVHYPGKGSCHPYIRLFEMSSLIPL